MLRNPEKPISQAASKIPFVNNNRIVFVASLSHSGSTLLDLLLGAHPRMIGLGEIYRVIDRSAARLAGEKRMQCTCGRRVGECNFWNPVIDQLIAMEGAPLTERYARVLSSFGETFGPDALLVDSSKYLRALKLLAQMPALEVSAIHLLRDVRGFSVSQRKALDAELQYSLLPRFLKSAGLSRWLYSNTLKRPSYQFWRWYLRNRATSRLLEREQMPHTELSYEALCAAPEREMARIYHFLGLEAIDLSQLAPTSSQSHIFLGNPMIADAGKMTGIRYDDRWQSQHNWRLAARLFPQIMRYNQEKIYPPSTE
jgi:hypothetical protein